MDDDTLIDLVFIKERNTGSDTIEVHWLTGKSGFTKFGGHRTSPLRSNESANGSYQMAHMDDDLVPDLVFVKERNARSRKVELHWVTGSSDFTKFGGHRVTGFTLPDADNGTFVIG